ncbi:MAG: ATP-binding protein [Propionibacteriaceae bacterium]|nr:ATP-binding protein [Propionibacteriaceae bacterium]
MVDNSFRQYIPRHAEALVEQALADTRVVLVNGARQCGKSTLARRVAARHDGQWLSFDNPQTLAQAHFDPVSLVTSDRLVIIDEVQRYPEILLTIKQIVDEHPRPGSFLITGSAHVMGLRSVPDTLPGRVETIELWPFSQGEIDGTPDGFIDVAFQYPRELTATSDLGRADYAERIARGGFPEAIGRTERRRASFLSNYVADLVNRDVTQVAEIQRGMEFRQILNLLAGQTSGLLVPANLAMATGLSKTTVSRYLAVMAEVFLTKITPAWSRGTTGRTTKTPKLQFVDSGVAVRLAGHDSRSLLRQDAPIGPMLESFVAMELARQATWSQTAVQLFHYRTKDGQEVDILLQDALGRTIGIEVKASSTVRGDDFRGLSHLAQRLGDDFLAGVVLYTGGVTSRFGDRLVAMPVSALWQTRRA